jgi:uncharacterized protein DUF3237
MRPPFMSPPISTREIIGRVELIASFQIDLVLDSRVLERTARGQRIHQSITGGSVSGPRLQGTVYPNGGGEYGLIRADAIEEWFSRFMLKADNGEWLYTQLVGYVRPDGYARFQATFDADVQGPHAWLNESMFIGTLEQTADHQQRRMSYFEAT